MEDVLRASATSTVEDVRQDAASLSASQEMLQRNIGCAAGGSVFPDVRRDPCVEILRPSIHDAIQHNVIEFTQKRTIIERIGVSCKETNIG